MELAYDVETGQSSMYHIVALTISIELLCKTCTLNDIAMEAQER